MTGRGDAGGLDDGVRARRAALQRAAFGRHATPVDIAALAEFEHEVERSGEVEHRRAARDLPGGGGAEPGVAGALDALNPPADPDASARARKGVRGRLSSRRARRAVVVGAVLTVAVLTLSTAVLSVRLAESEAIAAGSAPAEGADPLDRLAGTQSAEDLPDATLPNDYDLDSVRRLLDPDQTVLTDDYELFGARDDDGRVCLIVAFPDHHVAASCVSLAELRRDGVRIATNVYRSSRASLGSDVLVSHTVVWLPDDTFEFTSSLADDRP